MMMMVVVTMMVTMVEASPHLVVAMFQALF